MSKIDTIKKFFQDLETTPQNTSSSLANNFEFSGPVPEPFNSRDFISSHTALKKAFPDIKFNCQNAKEEGGKVTCTCQLTGTHKNELRVLDLPVVAPTGKRFSLPKENVTFSFQGDKIATMNVQSPPNGGLPEIYKQIGAKFPEHELV
jgi:predicted ester cyclase